MRVQAKTLTTLWDELTEVRLCRLESEGRGIYDTARFALSQRGLDLNGTPLYCWLLSDAYRFARTHAKFEDVSRDAVIAGPQCLTARWERRCLTADRVMFPLVEGNTVTQYVVTAKLDGRADRMFLIACDRLDPVVPKGEDIAVAWGDSGIFTL